MALAGEITGGRLGEGEGGNQGVVIFEGEGVLVTILPREDVVGRLYVNIGGLKLTS